MRGSGSARIIEALSTPRPMACLVALFVLVYGIATMSRYGVTFDAPALFYAGDRTLFALTHPSVPGGLDLLSRNEPAGLMSVFGRHPDWEDPVHYPVAFDVLCAVTSYIFHERLKALDVVDGHHIGLLFVYAFTLGAYAFYTSRLLGRCAGAVATAALAFYPSAMGHSFNNPKDWPCAMFYALGVLAFGLGIVERRPRGILTAGLWIGLSLSAKINGAFALVTLAVWWSAAYMFLSSRPGRAAHRRMFAHALIVPMISIAVFIALWPWLYYRSPWEIWARLESYVHHFVAQGVTRRPYWWAYSFRCALWMTPPITLLAACTFGLSGWIGSRRRRAAWLLLLIWTAIPLLRIAMPRVNVYDGNRQFIEYVPALCAMAGAGVAAMGRATRAHLRRRVVRPWSTVAGGVMAVTALSTIVWPIAHYYPYEVTYYNSFAGGLGAAQRLGLSRDPLDREWPEWVTAGSEGDYWYTSLRDAMGDVMALKGPDAVVGACGALPSQVRANAPLGSRFTVVRWDDDAATVLYVSPRETVCQWRTIRSLEATRRILKRVERDGGLIYELFGDPLTAPVTPLSGENWYTENR